MPLFRRLAPAFVAVFALPALAQDKPTVTVLPYAPLYGELSPSTGFKAADLIVAEITAQDWYEGLNAPADATGPQKKSGETEIAAAQKRIATAKSQISAAITQYGQRRMKPSAVAMEKAIVSFIASFHGADDFSALSDAYLGLAMARFRLGDEGGAFKSLDDVVRIDPNRSLEGQEFPAGTKIPPLFVKFHEKARETYFEKERGQVRITSNPSGATVLFDGREIGETPLLATQVLPGEHYVRVVKPGVDAVWQKINVASGDEVTVSANFVQEATGPLASIGKTLGNNSITPDLANAIQKIGAKADSRFVVFGAYRQQDTNIVVRSWLLRVEDTAVVQMTDIVFDLEMFGAAIEVYKLANDFNEKLADFQGVTVQSELIPFPRAKAPKVEEAFTTVAVTGAKGPTVARKPADDNGGGRRGPVRAVVETRKGPVAAAKVEEEASAVEETKQAGPRRLRSRGKIGEDGPSEVAEPAKPRLSLDEESDNRLDLDLEEPTSGKIVDLEPKSSGRHISALDPEELARLQGIEDGNKKSNVGKVLLWSGVGVVGAGAVATGLYFLLSSSTPTSATAHVSW